MAYNGERIILIGLLLIVINLLFSVLPGKVEADSTSPGAIANLSALSRSNVGELDLFWPRTNGATTRAQVTILTVYLSKDKYCFGEINLSGSTKTFADTTVTSGGSVNQTSSLKVSLITLFDNSPSLWKSMDTIEGHNRFILYSIFHRTDVALGNFETDDILVAQNRSSKTERYTYEGGSPPHQQTGEGVPPGEERKIWFRLDMPTNTSTAAEEKIKITITAELNENIRKERESENEKVIL